MNPNSRRLEQRQAETETAAEQAAQQSGVREFATVEAVLREDRAGTSPPSTLEHRVAKAIRQSNSAHPSWWKRWFGGGAASP